MSNFTADAKGVYVIAVTPFKPDGAIDEDSTDHMVDYYPEMMVSVVREYAKGDLARGRDLFDAYLPLARFEQQPGLGLAIRKHVLAQRGVIAHDALRSPGAALSAASQAEIALLMKRLDARLKELN